MGQGEVQTLLDDYNFYRTHTNNYRELKARFPGMKLARMNKQREKLLTEMVAWCRANQLDPRHWLYGLFCRGRWLYAPKWTPGFLMSKTGLQWYRQKGERLDSRLYQQRINDSRAVEEFNHDASRTYNPLVDTSVEVEARKERFQRRGDLDGCLQDVRDPDFPTLGFHPKSKVCQACSLADACKQQLRSFYPFDIVALREGALTVRQAHLIAAVHNGRS